MMWGRKLWLATLGAGLLAVATVGSAQQPQDPKEGPGEKAGESIDNVIQDIKEGVKDVSQDIREGFRKTKARVEAMGVESRVYGRIHWDKSLNEAPIELDVTKEGVAVLRGAVGSQDAKSKAVTIASETVGVTRVVDQLTVSAEVEAENDETP